MKTSYFFGIWTVDYTCQLNDFCANKFDKIAKKYNCDINIDKIDEIEIHISINYNENDFNIDDICDCIENVLV